MISAKHRKQKLVTEINTTPFTDIILVLLIIFMVTTPLISQSNIKVNLPQAASGKSPESAGQSQVSITITNEGLIYLDESPVTRKEFREKINAMYRSDRDLSVVLRSDRLVRFKDIVGVLDPINEMGITKLSIAVTPEK
ncbi:MAG: biopolymer transporter ExbD [Candidatus Omnitrophota bacterium]|nr:biopolymer transporter ExbD [Candidatus Omnitrophota bacterium]MBU2034672.1 biopolymer transporter ExbD [Candidatus Omnitrophota bacterium]MBU2221986.1 biopolymer transporter ExbD [Candidatus Omnitrophota bacterium]MBU2257493.1 biopolymer transporter ExbD [Candidatus Omnitrophota bacterium]